MKQIKKAPRDLWDISKHLTYITGVPQEEERETEKNFLNKNCIYLRRATWWFDIHTGSEMMTKVTTFAGKSRISNVVLLTVVITLYIRSLHLFMLHNCNFVPTEQHIPISPNSIPLITNILISASTYSTLLDSTLHHAIFEKTIWVIARKFTKYSHIHKLTDPQAQRKSHPDTS